MISYQDALDIIRNEAHPLQGTLLPLGELTNRVLAEDLVCPLDVPGFRNSAMDGYAVCAADLAGASKTAPVCLPVQDRAFAGDGPAIGTPGQAWEITTGAPVPACFDAVVPVEQTSHLAGNVQFVTQPEQGAHIRLPGEDFSAGTTLLLAGERLTPERLMGLATQGIHSALVRVPPVVHIFSTGNELVDPASGRSLRPGQIYNSNGPYLAALARQAGCDLRDEGILSDDPERFVAAVNRCLPESILITTGAVSMGSRDFIPQSLKTLGAEVLFHKVFIRPGKPVLFARLPGRRWFFGLPGNPVSAAVGFRFFVMPLLRQCLGQPQEQPLYARLEKDWHKPHSLRHFLKAHLRLDSQGQYHVLPDPGQMSFMVRPLLHTQGWMLVEETRHHIRAGETVSFYPYHTGGLFDA